MKKWMWIFGVLAIGAVLWFYANSSSSLREQMEGTLSSACRRPVSIQSAQLLLPGGMRLSGIVVSQGRGEDRVPLTIDEIRVQYSVSSLTKGQPGAEVVLIRPKLYIEWTREVQSILQQMQLGSMAGSAVPMTSFQVKEGALTFVDRLAVPNVFWNFEDLAIGVQSGPGSGEYTYTLTGSLKGDSQTPAGDVKSEGSFLRDGPLDAKVTLNHQDLKRLSPYLRQVLGTAPSQGAIHLESRFTIHQGVLMAYNDVTATGVAFPTDEPTTLGPDGKRLVQLLADREGKIHLSFIVSGKLGEKLNWSDLATGALREAMRQAMSSSIQGVLHETEQNKPVEDQIQKGMESLGR